MSTPNTDLLLLWDVVTSLLFSKEPGMIGAPNTDLLWDFVTRLGPEPEFRLRLFESEEELFRAPSSGVHAGGLPLSLPPADPGAKEERRGRRTGSSISTDQARPVGMRLWDSLPLPARERLQAPRPPGAPPLRLKISGDSPAVTDLPWEWLDDGKGPLALRDGLRVARSVPVQLPPPPLTATLPLRVLFVLTNPKDERLLDGQREIDAVNARLNPNLVRTEVCWTPQLNELVRHLGGFGPHVLHYIGHAGVDEGRGNVILHDPNHRTEWLDAARLAEILPSSCRLLCLSTCFTAPNYQILGLPRLAHAPASFRLPTAVVNQFPVREEAVRTFWEAFYAVLVGSTGDVNEAMHKARVAVAAGSPPWCDWSSFSLVLRDGSGESLKIVPGSGLESAPDNARWAAELEAGVAARLANELAEKLRQLGDAAPDVVRQQFKQERARASDLAGKITGEPRPK